MALKSYVRKLAPRAMRAYPILNGPLRGRLIVTSLHDYPGAVLGRTERPLLDWLRKNVRPGETWLDVGAHYGYTAIALAELVGTDGHVYAFEPSITTAGFLNRTRALNRLNQITVAPFGLAEAGDFRLLTVPVDRGMANHRLGGTATETIFMIGFDHLWMVLGERPVHGVKIDVQGMESQVLEGMRLSLANQKPKLVIEFHQGADRERIISLLRTAGYQLPGLPLEPTPSATKAVYHDDESYAFTPVSA